MYPEGRVQTNLRKGVLEWCALAVIQGGDIYGRDLARRLTSLGLLASEGSLYPLLSRLRESGWVQTHWAESASGPPRRYYRLTEAGRDAVAGFERTWREIAASVDEALDTRGKNHA
ncbi:PadR family transcriptional regulator [Microbacterium invictum]|uniref:PadR family transcriptional regulator PadR n=1 Tax=Microbacterium invictum TaxID=515415 RepID=A0AA40SS29_9MICO|nr:MULTISPECIES: PadR family transcriptional regulator [Microbacterium]MBB4141426.1 PadR family transcriptional regulator PadR [Microbacterium invictum]